VDFGLSNMLYIFDKDGTLVRRRGFLGRRRPPRKPSEQHVRRGVRERLAELRAEGAALVIASNINLVAFGVLTLAEAQRLMEDCARKIGGVHTMRFSPYDPGARMFAWLLGRPKRFARDDPSRKPHPGMLLEIMDEMCSAPWETVVIGNSPQDREAAKQAGVRFVRSTEFFRPRRKRARILPAGEWATR